MHVMVVITALRLCNFTIWSKCVLFFFYSTLVHCVCSPVVVHFDVRFLAIRYFLMSVLSLFLAFASDFSIALDHTHTHSLAMLNYSVFYAVQFFSVSFRSLCSRRAFSTFYVRPYKGKGKIFKIRL